MSEEPNEMDLDSEEHAYAVARKLFWITTIGAIAFSATVLIFFLL